MSEKRHSAIVAVLFFSCLPSFNVLADIPGDCVSEARTVAGQSLEQAQEHASKYKLTTRIVSKDGAHLAVTMDYRDDRLNLTIVDNHVTKAKCG